MKFSWTLCAYQHVEVHVPRTISFLDGDDCWRFWVTHFVDSFTTQVKQRLKTYLLNRRKQSASGVGVSGGGSRHRRTDDRYVPGSQANFSQSNELNPNSIAPRSSGSGNGGGGIWDSNDSANSFDSDWNEANAGGKWESQRYFTLIVMSIVNVVKSLFSSSFIWCGHTSHVQNRTLTTVFLGNLIRWAWWSHYQDYKLRL